MSPDHHAALDAGAITADLKTRLVGKAARTYHQVSSTMDVARQAALDGDEDGLVVVAEEQTAGRGRLQRRWVTPPGSSILMTILLRPSAELAPRLTLIAALALAEAIEEVTGLPVDMKWPNDVLIRGKKACGILVESEFDGETPRYSLLGIGVNVNFDPAELPEAIYPPTTLNHELGREVDRLLLLRAILQRLDSYLDDVALGTPVQEAWRKRLVTLGQRVKVTQGEAVEEGLAVDVGENGELVVQRDDGTRVSILAGDVTLRG